MSEPRIIVGIGNPGPEYATTRHNAGFMVVDELAKRHKLKFARSSRLRGWAARAASGTPGFVLLKPATFVNNSGESVAAAVTEKGFCPQDVLVVCDDLNLPFGQLRIRPQGSAGGHNGLKSIIEHLKSEGFARLRFGIGSPADKQGRDYVLAEFHSRELKELKDLVGLAADCCETWLTGGVKKAMDQFNKRTEDG